MNHFRPLGCSAIVHLIYSHFMGLDWSPKSLGILLDPWLDGWNFLNRMKSNSYSCLCLRGKMGICMNKRDFLNIQANKNPIHVSVCEYWLISRCEHDWTGQWLGICKKKKKCGYTEIRCVICSLYGHTGTSLNSAYSLKIQRSTEDTATQARNPSTYPGSRQACTANGEAWAAMSSLLVLLS